VTTEERVERKTKEYCKVKTRLNKLYQELCALKLQVANEKYGVGPGVLVLSHGELYRVHTVIVTFYPDKPWVLGRRKLPSGHFSGVITHLYAVWELAPEKEA
jgi:hypothetical protein